MTSPLNHSTAPVSDISEVHRFHRRFAGAWSTATTNEYAGRFHDVGQFVPGPPGIVLVYVVPCEAATDRDDVAVAQKTVDLDSRAVLRILIPFRYGSFPGRVGQVG